MIHPTRGKILTKALPIKKESGGILLPDVQRIERDIQLEVVAVGLGRIDDKGKTHEMDVKASDFVLCVKKAGQECETPEGKFTIIRQQEVIAVLEKV